VEGIREGGHETVEVPHVDWAEGLVYPCGNELSDWRARTWETVEAFVRRERAKAGIDAFIGYLYPQQIEVGAIRELQRSGIPCVNFFCDNVREFASVPAEYAPFSLHWVPEFEALSMYRQASFPHIHAAMPCWIAPEFRAMPIRETEPPTFLGSADELRRDLLGRALQLGADFVVRGPAWPGGPSGGSGKRRGRSISDVFRNQIALARRHGVTALLTKLHDRVRPLRPPAIEHSHVGAALYGENYMRVTREATVAIGVSRVASPRRSVHRPVCYSRLRDIEAPMLGACYLTEWTQGLGRMYQLGAEVETYRTAEELADKLRMLRMDPGRRAVMRVRAQRRALADHSVAPTIRRIKKHLGL
jgi:Glycosyl transferases group 1